MGCPGLHMRSFPLLLITCSSSRLSLESSALRVDSAAWTPRPSVTPLSFSPSVGGTWGLAAAQLSPRPQALLLGQRGQGPPIHMVIVHTQAGAGREGQWCLPQGPLLPHARDAPPYSLTSAFCWALVP